MLVNSLYRRFLRWLLWPIAIILLLGSGITYLSALRAEMSAYDLGLLDNALDLSRQVEIRQGRPVINLPPAAQQMLQANNEDLVAYAAWDDTGELFSGTPDLLAPGALPPEENRLFRDIIVHGEIKREVLLRGKSGTKDFYIAVSQTLHGRNDLADKILASILLPEAFLALVSIAAILYGVRRGLSPVQRLHNEIMRRSPSDLRPIEESSVPAELAPIIHSVNELLGKLSASFASHRRFIADAAHQLRTPLASLSGQIEVALQAPPENVEALLHRLLLTTRRTSHLANQLLSLARLEHTEQSMYESASVELDRIISDTAADFVTLAARKDIELDFDLQPCRIQGSPLMLRELLANLLDNAVRYTPQGGKVSVTLQAQDGTISLCVKDSGCGVPESELEKLGIPFHRLTSENPEGCGLGLAIVREIARLHNAQVLFGLHHNGSGLRACITFRSPAAMA